ncbi:MAG: hydrolase [Andreesenia angusta]|nr:hydrolase [Andreesenia angusta]
MKKAPIVSSSLRYNMIYVPSVIDNATGIRVNGKTIKSLVFTTDVAIIRNINANAVMAVYPFTPQPIITHALMMAAELPVFCGVGGGITTGMRAVNLALDAEFQGASGVVLNAPTSNEVLINVRKTIDIPIIITVGSENTDIDMRLDSGADIINISGGPRTIDIIKSIRKKYPDIPIIATGGPNDETIEATIDAGANAITYSPPTTAELFTPLMTKYRK